MSILVCGGAGYIGSHMVLELIKKNHDVVIIDNLSSGAERLLNKKARFYKADVRNEVLLNKILKAEKIEAVVDFAALSLVGESNYEPAKYYDNNLVGTYRLLNAIRENGINKIIFSSTAAVYGEPVNTPIKESNLVSPINAYGETKAAIENMLHWFDRAYEIKYVTLRYFNVAGADKSALIGEMHNPETHLIPIVLKAVIENQVVKIFGGNYPTLDGTCVRDYIHVSDLVNAHMLALEYLIKNTSTKKESRIYNLGNNKGISVLEIIKSAEKITGKKINYEIVERRVGDPAVLIACHDKIKNELGWKPVYSSIDNIISTAWNWHKNNK